MQNRQHGQPQRSDNYIQRADNYTRNPNNHNRSPSNFKQNNYEPPNSFLSGLLCFLTILLVIVFIFLMVFSPANMNHIIHDFNIAGILTDIDEEFYILHQINMLPFNNAKIEYVDLEEFIKSDAVSHEIGAVVAGYARAIQQGDLDHHLSTEDLVGIVRNLEPELYELFDHRMTEEQYQQIAETIDDIVDFGGITAGDVINDVDFDLTIPALMFSSTLIWIVGIACVVLLVITFLIRRKNIVDAFLFVGIPIAVAGFISFALGLWIGTSPQLLGERIYLYLRFFISPLALLTQYGFVFAAAGVTIIAISFMFKSIAPRRI